MGLIRKAILGAVASLIIYQTLHYLLFDAYAVWRFAPTRETIANKRVLVTGSSKGIGRELVELYSELGAHVTLHGRSEAALIEVSKECLKRGAASVNIAVGDMSKVGDAEKVVRSAADAMGGLDIVIVNHISPYKFETIQSAATRIKSGDFQRDFQVDMLSYAETAAAAAKHLEHSSGSIVFISSGVAKIPVPYFYEYSFAKRALEGLVVTFRQEVALNDSSIHIGIVHLGLIDTQSSRDHASTVFTKKAHFSSVRNTAISIASVPEGRLKHLMSPWFLRPSLLVSGLFPEYIEQLINSSVKKL